jgi:hypothetical protein
MHNVILSALAGAALVASVGIANAKGPVKLSDVQLDTVTAGAADEDTHGTDLQGGDVHLGDFHFGDIRTSGFHGLTHH